MDWYTHAVPHARCVSCGETLEFASSYTTKFQPDPGDITVCTECGALNMFDGSLQLRALTSDEHREADASTALTEARAVVQEAIRRRKRGQN